MVMVMVIVILLLNNLKCAQVMVMVVVRGKIFTSWKKMGPWRVTNDASVSILRLSYYFSLATIFFRT